MGRQLRYKTGNSNDIYHFSRQLDRRCKIRFHSKYKLLILRRSLADGSDITVPGVTQRFHFVPFVSRLSCDDGCDGQLSLKHPERLRSLPELINSLQTFRTQSELNREKILTVVSGRFLQKLAMWKNVINKVANPEICDPWIQSTAVGGFTSEKEITIDR